jgi:hypothetical protein
VSNFNLRAYLNSQVLLEDIPGPQADEAELDALDKEIASAFASGLGALQGQVAEVKEQVAEAETNLKEAVVTSLLVSILLSAPKLLEIIGGMVNKIAAKFSKDGFWTEEAGYAALKESNWNLTEAQNLLESEENKIQ